MKLGRKMSGNPSSCPVRITSSSECAIPDLGTSIPMAVMQSLKRCRSSAFSIASSCAPMSWQPYFARIPSLASCTARFRAVCPPMVGRTASGRSTAMIRSAASTVIGSMYVRSAHSASVMIVAGLEFSRMVRYPSSRSALRACTPE